MSFLYNSFNTLWNQATSYFPETAKYGESNNISWSTVGHLASDIGFIATRAPLAAAEAVGNAAMNAVTGSAAATHTLAYAAKDLLAQSAYSALEQTHDWQFKTVDGKSDGAAKSSATMVAELAGAAGSKLLDLGYSAFKSGYAALADKTAQLSATAWSEVKVQAPVLGAALLGGVEYVAGKMAAAAHEGLAALSAKPLDLDTMLIAHGQDDVLQCSDWAFVTASEVLPSAAAPSSAPHSIECIESHFSDEDQAFALPSPANEVFHDLSDDCAALTCSAEWMTPNAFATSMATAVY